MILIRPRLWLAAAALTCGTSACPALAQITRTGNTFQFRVRFASGQKLNYVLTTTSTPKAGSLPRGMKMPDAMIMTGPMRMRVVGIKGALTTLQVSAGPFLMNGRSAGKAQTSQLQVDEHNKPVNAGGGAAPQLGSGLPPHPLKVGESYSLHQTMTTGGQSITVQAKYTFKGVKRVGALRVAQLDSATTITGKDTQQGVGTMYLDVADGTLVSSITRTTATRHAGSQTMILITESVITRR